jgi:Fic family protein
MDKYIQKLHFNFLANQRVMQLIAAIDEYRGKWNIVEKRENRYLKELRRIATIESIGSSTRIEGATMTDGEIQKLLKSVKITKFETRDEQEVVGYYEVLALVLDNFPEIRLSESYIKQLHQLLLKHSNKDERHRGVYKSLSNKVVANYSTGEQKTVKISDLSFAFPYISPNTLKKDLQYLKAEQIISTVGQGKGTVYVA